MKTFGRIAICGAVSQYNRTGPPSQGIVLLHVGGLDRLTDMGMGPGWLSCLLRCGWALPPRAARHLCLMGVWQFPLKEKKAWLLPPSGHIRSLIVLFLLCVPSLSSSLSYTEIPPSLSFIPPRIQKQCELRALCSLLLCCEGSCVSLCYKMYGWHRTEPSALTPHIRPSFCYQDDRFIWGAWGRRRRRKRSLWVSNQDMGDHRTIASFFNPGLDVWIKSHSTDYQQNCLETGKLRAGGDEDGLMADSLVSYGKSKHCLLQPGNTRFTWQSRW